MTQYVPQDCFVTPIGQGSPCFRGQSFEQANETLKNSAAVLDTLTSWHRQKNTLRSGIGIGTRLILPTSVALRQRG